MTFSDKFNMSQNESLFLFKKHFASVVYTGLKMENRNITFPETEVILSGVNVGDVKLDDVYAIIGMKRASRVLLDSIHEPLTFDIIKKFNYYIAETEAIESGVVRNGSVSISGTNYIPEIPDENVAKRNIVDILTQNVSTTEKALNLFLHLIYKQYFWDGNKRTALFASNFLLVQNCSGLLEIKDKYMKDFAVLLNEMFNTGIQEKLKAFLYKNCIEGITK